jgi:hypothetical protein
MAFKAPVLNVPLAALAPLQSPPAMQELGLLVELQVKVTVVPGFTGLTGLLERLAIGRLGGGSFTATVTVA